MKLLLDKATMLWVWSLTKKSKKSSSKERLKGASCLRALLFFSYLRAGVILKKEIQYSIVKEQGNCSDGCCHGEGLGRLSDWGEVC